MALVTTIGGSTSDSYVTIGEANTYFANHWQIAKATLWSTLETGQRESVLRAAATQMEGVRVLDDYLQSGQFYSTLYQDTLFADVVIHKLVDGQRLSFPRNIDVNDVGPFIPTAVKQAQCEQAIYMITLDDTALANQFIGIVEERVKAGGVEIHQRFGSSRSGSGTTVSPLSQSLLSPMTVELLKPFMRHSKRMLRG